MKKVIFSLFETYPEANDAVAALNADGYNNNQISVVAQSEVLAGENIPEHSETAEDAGKGAGIGGLTGLILGILPVAIPGVGPVITAGTIIGGAISGAGLGAGVGSLVGLFREWTPDEEAKRMSEAVKSGHILLAVETSELGQANVEQTLQRYGGYDIHTYPVRERARG